MKSNELKFLCFSDEGIIGDVCCDLQCQCRSVRQAESGAFEAEGTWSEATAATWPYSSSHSRQHQVASNLETAICGNREILRQPISWRQLRILVRDFPTCEVQNIISHRISSFSTSDGQEKFEKGTIQADQTFVVEGYYTYTDTDNNKVVRKYRSDKDGYQIIE